MKKEDFDFVKSILPDHYQLKESDHKGSIHCISSIGIRHKIDADDDEHWEYIVKAIEDHFGTRFMEIDHITNFCHQDFTIYLRGCSFPDCGCPEARLCNAGKPNYAANEILP